MITSKRGWVGTYPATSHNYTVTRLLRYLGIDVRTRIGTRTIRRTPFWRRSEWDILDTFKQAAKSYRAQAKKLHPDGNGNDEQMKNLNRIWSALKRAFARRGFTLENS